MARREKIVKGEGIFRAVRVQIGEAEEKLQTACKLLRENGWPENADELAKELRRLRVWTGKDGWLDALERGAGEGRTE